MSKSATVMIGGYQQAYGPVVHEHDNGKVTVAVTDSKNVTGWPVGRDQPKR